jgi:hypothetical protein
MLTAQLIEQYETIANLPHHAWAGGYALEYVMLDGGTLCAACVHDTSNPVTFDIDGDDKGWIIAGVQTLEGSEEFEGSATCDNCNKNIWTD